jgi:Xaa-Pro dipeptidase
VLRLREQMRKHDADLVLVTGPENQYYLTGLRTGTVHTFMVLIVPLQGEGVWVVRRTELSNVESLKDVSWVKRGVGVVDGDAPVQVLADTLCELGFEHSRMALDRRSYFFHTEFQLELQRRLDKVTIVDATGWVEAGRAIKSVPELTEIRAAGVITSAGLSRGIESIAEGVTDRQLGATLTSTAIEAGSEGMSQGPYVTVGKRTFMAHSSWIGQAIERGDLISTELAARVNGYNAPCFRVSVIGKPSESLSRFHAASE